MTDSIQLEGRTIAWSKILAAYHDSKVFGLTVLFRQPPFVSFVGINEAHYKRILEGLEQKGFVTSAPDAHQLLDELTRELLAQAITSLFEDPKAAYTLLEATTLDGKPLSPRLALACISLSHGDLSTLKHWCQEAQIDYRDVYMAAWY